MFSNLFGKKDSEKNQLFVDRVFMTTAAKMNACALLAKGDESYLFLAWFSDTAQLFKTFFTERGIDQNRVLDAKQFDKEKLLIHKPVMLEHYPLALREINLVKEWNCTNIIVYSAMDEPLFKHFGSEKLLPMMKMLGMKESEMIMHAMVSNSIAGAQEKIAGIVTNEKPVSSQAEWVYEHLGRTI